MAFFKSQTVGDTDHKFQENRGERTKGTVGYIYIKGKRGGLRTKCLWESRVSGISGQQRC